MIQITPLTDETCPSCEKHITPAPDATGLQFCQHCRLPLALVAGKYKIEKPLAEGGCGILYLSRHTHLTMEPMRVLKFLKPEFFEHPHAAQRFAREVEVTAALSQRNNHIVRVYDDFGEIPGLGHYYVMEYLRGADLHTRLRDGTMPLDTILHIAQQLLEAIQDAHEAQIIHRDLKPHNVYLIERGSDKNFVKVIDFGIAKGLSTFADTGMTQGVLGTPEYMAPEQCTGQTTDQRTDIYAIGMILYEMLVGHTPFLPPGARGISAMNMAIAQMMESPKTPREARPERDIPPALEAVIMRAIAKSPEDRWPSAQAMKEALQGADPYQGTTPEIPAVLMEAFSSSSLPSGDGYPVVTPEAPPTPQAPAPSPSRPPTLAQGPTPATKRLLWASLAVLICGGLGGLALWKYQQPSATPASKAPPPGSHATKRRAAPETRVPKTQTPRRAPERALPQRPALRAAPTSPKRRVRRVRRTKRAPRRRLRKLRRAPPRRAASHCPPTPKGQRWLRLRVSPASTKVLTQATMTQSKRGWRCVLITPKAPPTLTFKRAGYHLCYFQPKATTRILRVTLRKEADQLNTSELPAEDYCR